MWDLKACRGCLSTRNRLEKITPTYEKLYTSLTGLQITETDGFPKYFCFLCQNQMKKTLAFKRKCRRAYYVLMEIMNVRKQVTVSELMQVNRVRTNLVSPIGYDRMNNTGIYTVYTVESDLTTLKLNHDRGIFEEPKGQLFKQPLNEGNIWHIDVIPTETNNEVETPPVLEVPAVTDEPVIETQVLTQPAEDVANFETVPEPSPEQDIDEVFNEPLDEPFDDSFNDKDSDDGWEPLEPPPKKKRCSDLTYDFKQKIRTGSQLEEAVSALCLANIRRLTLEEQKKLFLERQNEKKFRLSVYKCALCLIVCKNLNHLKQHAIQHNRFLASSHICVVCKTKFLNEQDLTMHEAEKHEHEFACQLCPKSTFNIMDKYIDHYRCNHSDHVNIEQKTSLLNMKRHFKICQATKELMEAMLSNSESEHACTVCPMKFANAKVLAAHLKKHSEDRPSKDECTICKVRLESPELLTKHMESWHMFMYECLHCMEKFFNRSEAKHHTMDKHNLSLEYACNICLKEYSSFMALRLHCANRHYALSMTHHCNLCGDSFWSVRNLFKHQLMVHKRISVRDCRLKGEKCVKCDIVFRNYDAYQNHCIKHSHEEAKSFANTCFPCRKIFKNEGEYDNHVNNVCPSAKNQYPKQCQYCTASMQNYLAMRKHLKEHHPQIPRKQSERLKLCEICGVAVENYMATHMRTHAADYQTPKKSPKFVSPSFDCEHCDPPVKFPKMWRYTSHVLKEHTLRPYICALCDASFEAKFSCRSHILKVHSPSFTYKCVACNDLFPQYEEYMEHCKSSGHTMPTKIKNGHKKFYIYPHMKLNVSMFNREYLSSLRMFCFDFRFTTSTRIENVFDYLVFDKQEKIEMSKKKSIPIIKKESKKSSVSKETKMLLEETYYQMFRRECDERDPAGEEEKELDVKTLEVVNEEIVEEMELSSDGEKYLVVEEDGVQYVNINGILYTVVHDEESITE